MKECCCQNQRTQEVVVSESEGRRVNRSLASRIQSLAFDFAFLFFGMAYAPIFLSKLGQAERPSELLLERLGFLPEAWREKFRLRPVIWIHAVSVGEVMAVRKFLAGLLERLPKAEVVLTTVTPTGQKIALELKGERVTVSYFPFDITHSVRPFFSVLNPRLVLLVETELWPNLLAEAGLRQVPVGLLNGRLSPRSFALYRRFGFLFRPLFAKLDFVLAQTEEDGERFSGLGVPRERIHVLGNMKFDNAALDETWASSGAVLKGHWGFNGRDRLWVAGSTHPGEEEILIEVFRKLRDRFPTLKMVMAPRHIERSKRLSAQIRKLGFRVEPAAARSSREIDILVLDRLGILKDLYAMADVVFVGGSLVPHGGQNPIEPAAFKRAILHGPHVANFRKVYEGLDGEGGAVLVRDGGELLFALTRLLDASGERERETLGANAFRAVRELQGATERTLQWVLNHLESLSPRDRSRHLRTGL